MGSKTIGVAKWRNGRSPSGSPSPGGAEDRLILEGAAGSFVGERVKELNAPVSWNLGDKPVADRYRCERRLHADRERRLVLAPRRSIQKDLEGIVVRNGPRPAATAGTASSSSASQSGVAAVALEDEEEVTAAGDFLDRDPYRRPWTEVERLRELLKRTPPVGATQSGDVEDRRGFVNRARYRRR